MNLYLIAHCVRGEAAFDVAAKIPCPVCEPMRQGLDDGSAPLSCSACDDGRWWIIPTSGHRAYPYWHMPLIVEGDKAGATLYSTDHLLALIPSMPEDCPDHYANESIPYGKVTIGPKLSLADLGIAKPKPTIQRRI